MVNRVCQGHCDGWQGMINFIGGIPKYALADRCIRCTDLWFPKGVLNNCPCCKTRVRHGRKRYHAGQTKFFEMSKDDIARQIEEAMTRGWTLLNKDIWKTVIEYRVYNKLDLGK